MTKIAFMFPGQGSYEAGMGRDVAEAVPEAMAVYEAGSAASGSTCKQICFHDPVENLLDTKLQQPALVATSLAINEAIRRAGSRPTSSSATRSASSPRSAPRVDRPRRRSGS